MLNKEEIERAKQNTKNILEFTNPLMGFKDFDYEDVSILLQYIEQLENKLKEQEEYIKDYKRILDIFDNREYRKRYLKERRAEEKGLLYPDADEIYKKYYKQEESRQELINKLRGNIEELENKSGGNTYHVQTIINNEKRILQEILNLIEGEKK